MSIMRLLQFKHVLIQIEMIFRDKHIELLIVFSDRSDMKRFYRSDKKGSILKSLNRRFIFPLFDAIERTDQYLLTRLALANALSVKSTEEAEENQDDDDDDDVQNKQQLSVDTLCLYLT